MTTKQKILIVDDDNNIAELISLYLIKECYETHIVNDGEAALKAFTTFQPDLILLDLMPSLGFLNTVLSYVYSLGGFLAVYLMTIGMIEIQMFRRINLYAREIQKWFTIWVVAGFVGSLMPALSLLTALVELAAAVVMVVFFFRAAKNYGDGSGNFRVL